LGDNDGLIPGIFSEMKEMGLSWVKLLDRDGVSHTACRLASDAGIMPVVRLYRERPYPGRLDNKHLAALPVLVAAGAYYFERGNEPNLIDEWQVGQWPKAWDPSCFNDMVTDWLSDCEAIVLAGGYPAVDACSPGGNVDDIYFLTEWCKALKRRGLPPWMSRVWLAVHNAALNHPLDYPDDAVNQKEHPGQTIHTHYYPGGVPTGASNCIRKWEAIHQLVKDQLGVNLPVLCTEGGFWPGNAADNRYPTLSEQEASNRQATVLRQMQTAPPYLFAQMPWLLGNRLFANLLPNFEIDAWKRSPGYGNCPTTAQAERPVMAALKAIPCRQRSQTVEEAIGAVAQKHVLPLNMGAALAKAAALKGYVPASDEFDTVVAGTTYRAQVFRDPNHLDLQHIAYCVIGDWGHITFFDRKN
jgi:hypothetical protein